MEPSGQKNPALHIADGRREPSIQAKRYCCIRAPRFTPANTRTVHGGEARHIPIQPDRQGTSQAVPPGQNVPGLQCIEEKAGELSEHTSQEVFARAEGGARVQWRTH